MNELGYIPMRNEGGHLHITESTHITLGEPLPEPPECLGFAVVQPFPVIETKGPHELVVPPREYGTLVERPAVREAA